MGNFKWFVLNLLTDNMEVDVHMFHMAVKAKLEQI